MTLKRVFAPCWILLACCGLTHAQTETRAGSDAAGFATGEEALIEEPAPESAAEGTETPPPGEPEDEVSAGTAELESERVPPLEQALVWAEQGLRAFQAGDLDSARRHLNDARILLLEAELPAAMQDKGLALLNCCMPPELSRFELERVASELDQALAPRTADLSERQFVEAEVRRLLLLFDSHPSESELQILLGEVEMYIRFYRGHYREFFERAHFRKHKYWPVIEEILGEFNLPVELGYMAMVESGFNPRAVSHANARGLWQFIPGTGRRYGLLRMEDFWDVHKSTRAAADYLRDLISIFGPHSFLLAMAGYNAGEGRIMGCLREVDDPRVERNFWKIRPCLMRETREYVPRILAAAVLSAEPRRFGFELESAEEVLARYEVVSVPYPTALSSLAAEAGWTTADLREVNTDLASTASTTPARHFPLYVPKGQGAVLAARAAELTAKEPEPTAETRVESSSPSASPTSSASRTYVVRRGDTLGEIAERHGTTAGRLASRNQLRPPYRLQVGQRLSLGTAGGASARAGSQSSPQTTSRPTVIYTVKSGNTLDSVAALFSVRYRDVMSWNHLSSTRLTAGQKLTIHPTRLLSPQTHTVKRGETAATIARRYGVETGQILTANGLTPRTTIRPGQRLLVYVRG